MTADTAWRQVDRLIDSVSELARSDQPVEEFYGELLRQTIAVLAASRGAVWARDPQGSWYLLADTTPATGADQNQNAQRTAGLRRVQETRRAEVITPEQGKHSGEGATYFVPVLADDQLAAVLELQLARRAESVAQQNHLDLLTALAELAGDHHRRQQFRASRDRDSQWQQLDQFLQAIHRQLDLDETCYAVVNDGRRLLGWDRLTLLLRHKRRYRVRAVSGLDRVDPRSAEVRHLQRLAAAVARSGESFWPDQAADGAPQILEPLSQYVDQTTSRTVVVLPLVDDDERASSLPHAVLVIERFDEHKVAPSERYWMMAIARHSRLAVQNALQLARIPWPARWAGALLAAVFGSRRTTAVAVAAVLVALGAALWLWPAELEVYCQGEIQPAVRQEVFAPADGLVERLLVETGQRVSRGAVLLELRNAELEFEVSRVLGELQTTRTQLRGIQASMSSAVRGGSGDRAEMHDLAAEEERLKELLNSLEQQRQVLERRQEELRVTSPLDGEVLTWDLRQRLGARPVRRGQRLLTVADPDGAWRLELAIEDHDLGAVLAARRQQTRPLPVRFLLLSDPHHSYQAEMRDVGWATEVDLQGQATVPAVAVPSDSWSADAARPGAPVAARIHCGTHSLGYVWFRDVIEILRARMWW